MWDQESKAPRKRAPVGYSNRGGFVHESNTSFLEKIDHTSSENRNLGVTINNGDLNGENLVGSRLQGRDDLPALFRADGARANFGH